MISENGFRVEVIIGSVVMPHLVNSLQAEGFKKYTLIRHATGNGGIFERSADDVTSVFSVDILILLISQDMLPKLQTLMEPFIETYGGIISVSECRLFMK